LPFPSCELWKKIVFIFWNSGVFNFLLVILGSLGFLCEVS
jgi:hypothetical protein